MVFFLIFQHVDKPLDQPADQILAARLLFREFQLNRVNQPRNPRKSVVSIRLQRRCKSQIIPCKPFIPLKIGRQEEVDFMFRTCLRRIAHQLRNIICRQIQEDGYTVSAFDVNMACIPVQQTGIPLFIMIGGLFDGVDQFPFQHI